MRTVTWTHLLSMAVLLVAGPRWVAADPPAGHAPAVPKKVFHLGKWERDIGYAQAVEAGPFLFVSGTVGRGTLDDPESWVSALQAAYTRIGTTLEAHGIGFEHVVKETIYARDIERLRAASAVRFDHYSRDSLPASTWVQVDRLFEPDLLVEVEVIAILERPSEAPGK